MIRILGRDKDENLYIIDSESLIIKRVGSEFILRNVDSLEFPVDSVFIDNSKVDVNECRDSIIKLFKGADNISIEATLGENIFILYKEVLVLYEENRVHLTIPIFPKNEQVDRICFIRSDICFNITDNTYIWFNNRGYKVGTYDIVNGVGFYNDEAVMSVVSKYNPLTIDFVDLRSFPSVSMSINKYKRYILLK